MVAGYEWFSPTRLCGLIAYSFSALACSRRWENCRRSHAPGTPFAALAGVQLCLFLDMVFNWRWKVHDFWASRAAELGVYSSRRMPQFLALVALALTVTITGALVRRRFRRRVGVAVAVIGTLFSIALWWCEAISFHYMDAILYHMIGNVMLVGLVWVSLAAITCFGVWLDGRSDAG